VPRLICLEGRSEDLRHRRPFVVFAPVACNRGVGITRIATVLRVKESKKVSREEPDLFRNTSRARNRSSILLALLRLDGNFAWSAMPRSRVGDGVR
jgi:hypothetical protein